MRASGERVILVVADTLRSPPRRIQSMSAPAQNVRPSAANEDDADVIGTFERFELLREIGDHQLVERVALLRAGST